MLWCLLDVMKLHYARYCSCVILWCFPSKHSERGYLGHPAGLAMEDTGMGLYESPSGQAYRKITLEDKRKLPGGADTCVGFQSESEMKVKSKTSRVR